MTCDRAVRRCVSAAPEIKCVREIARSHVYISPNFQLIFYRNMAIPKVFSHQFGVHNIWRHFCELFGDKHGYIDIKFTVLYTYVPITDVYVRSVITHACISSSRNPQNYPEKYLKNIFLSFL
jgi:hypothetical protein